MIQKRFASIVMTLLTSTLLAQESRPPLGLVIQVQGTAYLQRGVSKRAVRIADPLYSGDRVMADAGEVSILYCPTSEKLDLRAGSVVEIGPSELKLLKGTPPQRTKRNCAIPKIAFGDEELNLLGGMRARGYPPISLYVGGPITTSRPKFAWSRIENAEIYHISVRNNQNDIIWQSRVASSSAELPENVAALSDGEYEWEVRAQAAAKTVAQGVARFEVKPNAALAAQAAGSADTALLRAIDLENAGYFAEAAGIYREMRDAAPEDQRLTRRLAWLYWSAGLINAVNDEMKKLGRQ